MILTLLALSAAAHARPIDLTERLDTIAFGSCNFQRKAKDHWPVIRAQKPQLWIWGGDNIYADRLWASARRGEYNHLRNTDGYKELREEAMVVGTWDDHDYAYNDADKSYDKKAESQQLMLDFLDVPADAPVRRQEGVYQSYTFGPRHEQVKVILLDERYFRDAPDTDGDILGEAQWSWFEREMLTSMADLTIVVSSTQILAYEHPFERWAQYPRARQRFLDLADAVMSHGLGRVLVLSGDRHLAELSKVKLPGGQALYDLTSSGLTHGSRGAAPKNSLRVGEVFTERNFALIHLDWRHSPAKVTFEVKDHKGNTVLSNERLF